VDAEEFTNRLGEENRSSIERLGQLSAAGEAPATLTIDRLLKIALRNELEAAEIAAVWMASTPELEVKMALARQVGDEAAHYRLILERLSQLGEDTTTIDVRDGGYSTLFEFLLGLETTVERVAAGQFTREGIALERNRCFIEFCQLRGDDQTAALYRDRIQPDERHHHEMGRQLLSRLAIDHRDQLNAREAARRTIELAEEIQEMARLKSGVCRAPGC
jgi:1,2-phenylacetyl-CoA epoxidase catalytic subunit